MGTVRAGRKKGTSEKPGGMNELGEHQHKVAKRRKKKKRTADRGRMNGPQGGGGGEERGETR